MANIDSPNGFRPYKGNAPLNWYKHTASDGAAIAAGDAVIKDSNAGYIKIALETSGSLLGIAATGCAASVAADVAVYDQPQTEFEGQCEGDSALALVDTLVNIKGTTGIMEVDQGQTDEAVILVKKLHPADEVGTNGRVVFKIVKHQSGSAYDATA